jgi:hypothetical protein
LRIVHRQIDAEKDLARTYFPLGSIDAVRSR